MLNKTTHRIQLIQILNYLYKNSKIGYLLGFKGGTAGYLFYDLPRFSTDLDFDLLNLDISTDELIDNINKYVQEKYEILNMWNKKFTIFWKLSYEKNIQNIKIEINKRDSSNYIYQAKNLYGNSINVITPEHLIVQKLIALKNRKIMANRDIFDVNFYLKSKYASSIDYSVLEKNTGMNRKIFMEDLKVYLEKNSPKKILDGLGEVVEEDMKDWIKNEMLEETIQLIQMQIDSI